ncbi:MAG: hypothetical protein ALAOOOJD_01403 [bacterium]|nr:hypothetical protein [bacterium]
MNDRKLPGLKRALDDEAMLSWFASAQWNSALRENSLRQVRSRVLKYTPGKRCVIEYLLWFAGKPARPRRLIGKMYRKNRGESIFANWRQLWQAAPGDDGAGAHAGGAPLGMPEPLAYEPELGMLVQSAVPGQALSELAEPETLVVAMRRVAQNLATLHQVTAAVGEKKTLDDHLKKYCHPGPEVLSAAYPEIAPLVETLLIRLVQEERESPAPVCPVHGDLNLAQIFLAADRAFFIDFDGLCLSTPALDIANFLVTLQVHFGSRSKKLQNAFLEAYNARRPQLMLTGLQAYQAFAYLRRAVICTRAPAVADWRQQVRQLLEAGSAFLKSAA